MPRITIRRSPGVPDEMIIPLQDALERAVVSILEVEQSEIEQVVLEYGRLDRNVPSIGIDIDTGTGVLDTRLKNKRDILLGIHQHLLHDDELNGGVWIWPVGTYIWLLISGSAFLPISHPEQMR